METCRIPILKRVESAPTEDRKKQLKTVSAVTLWKDHPGLIPGYEAAMRGVDQVVIGDNGSTPENAALIHAMVERLRGVYIHNDYNNFFASGNNQGAKYATVDLLLFVNNGLSYRAVQKGFDLVVCHWQIHHLGGVTTAVPLGNGRQLPNYKRFVKIVKAN